jgi:mannose-6-phosphate isomerase-like protein (cupin superfamily)
MSHPLPPKIVLADKLALFDERWTPKIVGATNGQLVKLAKVEGDFVWHAHAAEDELFLVLRGRLVLEFRHGEVELGPGEMCIVPKGVEHRPRAAEETHLLLIEPASTAHTGETVTERTVAVEDQELI